MLNHNHYPTPGQVDFFISLLRDDKFSVVREEGRHTKSAADIQLMIDALKDIRGFLKLITRYETGGILSGSHRVQPGKIQRYISVLLLSLRCLSLRLLYFQAIPPGGLL